MNRAPQGGWVQKLGQVGGAVLGFKYGHYLGAVVPYLPPGPDGMLQYLVGVLGLWIATVIIANAIDARRQDNPGGTSPLGLIIGGLALRALARLIWAGLLLAPVVAAIWIYRSGILQGVLP